MTYRRSVFSSGARAGDARAWVRAVVAASLGLGAAACTAEAPREEPIEAAALALVSDGHVTQLCGYTPPLPYGLTGSSLAGCEGACFSSWGDGACTDPADSGSRVDVYGCTGKTNGGSCDGNTNGGVLIGSFSAGQHVAISNFWNDTRWCTFQLDILRPNGGDPVGLRDFLIWERNSCGSDPQPPCDCPGGTDYLGNPIHATTCGQEVCGADHQWYACEQGGWAFQGGVCPAPACDCPNGTDYLGNSIHSTTCGEPVCGADHQWYACQQGGWQAQGGVCPTPECECPDGVDYLGNPVDSITCGEQICGGDHQWYACQQGGWQAQGGVCPPPDCECPDGVDYLGNPVHSTTCGEQICGADYQQYSCEQGGWVAQGGTYPCAEPPDPACEPVTLQNTSIGDLDQAGAGFVAQALELVPDAQYELSFWHGVDVSCASASTFAVSIGGVEHVYTSSPSLKQEHLTFAAKVGETELRFTHLEGCGATIDAVDLQCSNAPRVWPNDDSRANSDPWLVEHHEALKEMAPRVLGLNFVSGAPEATVRDVFLDVAGRLAEGSRYHGYLDPSAPPFLRYQIEKIVAPASPPSRLGTDGVTYFDYGALFSDAFAPAYGYPDPANPGRSLNLCDLLAAGTVHEVWLYFDGTLPKGLEITEIKPQYDVGGNPVSGAPMVCTGNGCYAEEELTAATACGRSVKIAAYDSTRSPTEFLHSLGHGMEATAKSPAIPPFSGGFKRFANLDLNARFSSGFDDYYGVCAYIDVDSFQANVDAAGGTCPPAPGITDVNGLSACLRYLDQDSVAWSSADGALSGAFNPYGQGCGNVHFPANGRTNYDYVNPCAVDTTCEHYGLLDDGGGHDETSVYPPAGAAGAAFSDARTAYGDEGAWQMYWRQSMIGRGAIATSPSGRGMANWWPYLFY